MTTLYGIAALLGAAVLLYAGMSKVAAPRSFLKTLEAIGIPYPQVVLRLVPAIEVAAAAGLLVQPRSAVTAALVCALGMAFAAAGLIASRRRLNVACACFGRSSAGRLGIRQVLWLPAFVMVVLAAQQTSLDGPWTGPPAFCALALAIGAASCPALIREIRQNQAYLETVLPA